MLTHEIVSEDFLGLAFNKIDEGCAQLSKGRFLSPTENDVRNGPTLRREIHVSTTIGF
jgi:hypothetical protein